MTTKVRPITPMRSLQPAPAAYDEANEREFRTAVERAIQDITRPRADYEIVARPATPKRVVDAGANLSDVANVLATLILDLRSKGLV